MTTELGNYKRSFDEAQRQFGGEIDMVDHSHAVARSTLDSGAELGVLTEHAISGGYHQLVVSRSIVNQNPASYLNWALLYQNAKGVYSPAVITADATTAGRYFLSYFDVPYDPKVGMTDGYRWDISMLTQQRAPSFGAHVGRPSGFEKGHFMSAVIASADTKVASSILLGGDKATHGVLQGGATESMASSGLLPPALQPVTIELPESRLPLYWHERMQDTGLPIMGDYPRALELEIGAAFNTTGTGVDLINRIKAFTDAAVSGITGLES
jgi:hypothetical protein